MNAPIEPHRFILEPFEARRFANLCGQFDEHLRLIEQRLAIEIRNRGNQFELVGEPRHTQSAENLLRRLYRETKSAELSPDLVHLYLQESGLEALDSGKADAGIALRTKKGVIKPRGANQQRYVKSILDNDINFGIGPAGTGKTYLAVAAGLEATLEQGAYDRVLVFRPVVPVGRQDLGFLPGDVDEKISPWMKAIHDTLAQLFRGSHDADRRESYTQDLVQGLLDDGTVQLEPLTFIRGRTFARTFAILDEAQNVEYGVLRSLASRLGEGSKLVLCHDTSQVDHPYVDPDSGVAALIERLKGESLFGHVTLVKGERSPVAELVARKL